MVELSKALREKIIDFFQTLPNIHDPNTQWSLILQAELDSELQSQIPFGKTPAQFIPLLVSILLNFGTLHDGREPVIAVLEASKNLVGWDKKKYCDTLIEEIRINIDPSSLKQTIIEILLALPNIRNTDFQSDLVSKAKLTPELQKEIPFGAVPEEFVPFFISKLLEYSEIHHNSSPLIAVLEETKNFIDKKKKERCDTLIEIISEHPSWEKHTLSSSLVFWGGVTGVFLLFYVFLFLFGVPYLNLNFGLKHGSWAMMFAFIGFVLLTSICLFEFLKRGFFVKTPQHQIGSVIIFFVVASTILLLRIPKTPQQVACKGIVYLDSATLSNARVILQEAEISRYTNELGIFEMVVSKSDFRPEYAFLVYHDRAYREFIITHNKLNEFLKFNLYSPPKNDLQNIYVWDFIAQDGLKNNITKNLTQEFEETFIQQGCCQVLERRQYGKLTPHKKNESFPFSIEKISVENLDTLKLLNVDAVIFGQVYDNIAGDRVRINVTVQTLDGTTAATESIEIPKENSVEALGQTDYLQELVKKLCVSLTTVPIDPAPSEVIIVVEDFVGTENLSNDLSETITGILLDTSGNYTDTHYIRTPGRRFSEGTKLTIQGRENYVPVVVGGERKTTGTHDITVHVRFQQGDRPSYLPSFTSKIFFTLSKSSGEEVKSFSYLIAGLSRLILKDWNGATTQLTKALQQNSTTAPTFDSNTRARLYALRGMAEKRQGQSEQAQKDFYEAEKLAPNTFSIQPESPPSYHWIFILIEWMMFGAIVLIPAGIISVIRTFIRKIWPRSSNLTIKPLFNYGESSMGNGVYIMNARHGINCNLYCPYCKRPLIAKKKPGSEAEALFAHARRYNITQTAIEQFTDEGLPYNVIHGLQRMKNQIFLSHEDFILTLESHIGRDELANYRGIILKHTVSPKDCDYFRAKGNHYVFPLSMNFFYAVWEMNDSQRKGIDVLYETFHRGKFSRSKVEAVLHTKGINNPSAVFDFLKHNGFIKKKSLLGLNSSKFDKYQLSIDKCHTVYGKLSLNHFYIIQQKAIRQEITRLREMSSAIRLPKGYNRQSLQTDFKIFTWTLQRFSNYNLYFAKIHFKNNYTPIVYKIGTTFYQCPEDKLYLKQQIQYTIYVLLKSKADDINIENWKIDDVENDIEILYYLPQKASAEIYFIHKFYENCYKFGGKHKFPWLFNFSDQSKPFKLQNVERELKKLNRLRI